MRPRRSLLGRRSTTASSARTSSSCSRRTSFTRTRSRRSWRPGRSGTRTTRRRCRSCARSFPDGHLNKDVVGKSAQEIGAKAGLDIPEGVRVILVRADGSGTEDILAKEKLCPVVAIFPYDTFDEAVARAKANLLVEGAGHSAALHS